MALWLVTVVGGCRASRPPESISLFGEPLRGGPPGDTTRLENDLSEARAALAADPDNPDKIVWVGRRLGALWRMQEAIEVYTDGLRKHPNYAAFFRHRGHRYISVRRFDLAIADLQRAATLVRSQGGVAEPDSNPTEQSEPLTTLKFNIYYHLGLAHFLRGDYAAALDAYEACLMHTGGKDDNVVAVLDWMYITLRRLGRHERAEGLLAQVSVAMDITENTAYHRRLLMYKGVLKADDLLDAVAVDSIDFATAAFGIGNWYLVNGNGDRAREYFLRATSGTQWPAFGFIAAEVDLARMADAAQRRSGK